MNDPKSQKHLKIKESLDKADGEKRVGRVGTECPLRNFHFALVKLEMRPRAENDNVADGLGNVERIWKGREVYCAAHAWTCLL